MHRRPPARRGYTLLELLIASAIALVLMSALYFAFDLTIRSAETGRALVAESDLDRAVINRMTLDLSSPLGVLPPMSGGANSLSASTTTDTPAPATAPTATPSTTASGTTAAPLLSFQGGVIGTNEQLILFVSRVPTWLSDREVAADPNAILPSDAHRVSYYHHSGGKGLCRQDKPWITADRVGDSTDIDREAEDAEVIAPEVVALQFEYADGTGYLGEWDGTQASIDGSSATGPPRAVRVTLTFEYADRAGAKAQKKIVHVFPLRAAVGLLPADAATDTGGM